MREIKGQLLEVANPLLSLVNRCVGRFYTKGSHGFLLCMGVIVLVLTSCTYVGRIEGPVPINAELRYKPLYQSLDLKMGVCYTPDLLKSAIKIGHDHSPLSIGKASTQVFDRAFNAMFREVNLVDCDDMTVGQHNSFDGLLVVDIIAHHALLDWGIWLGSAGIDLSMGISLRTPDGSELKYWAIGGSGWWIYRDKPSVVVGKMFRDAIWDVASQFMLSFTASSGVKEWLVERGVSPTTRPPSRIATERSHSVVIMPNLALFTTNIGATPYGSSDKDYGFWFEHCVTSELRRIDPSLEIPAHDEVRGILFPWFERTVGPKYERQISELLSKTMVRNRLAEKRVRFVVSMWVLTTSGPVKGGAVRGSSIWGFGHEYKKWTTKIDAAVWDLEGANDPAELEGVGEGTSSLTSFVVPVPTSLARTEQKACKDIAEKLVHHFKQLEPTRPSPYHFR